MNARKWSSSRGISSLWVSPAGQWTERPLVQPKDSPLLLLPAGPGGVPSLGDELLLSLGLSLPSVVTAAVSDQTMSYIELVPSVSLRV